MFEWLRTKVNPDWRMNNVLERTEIVEKQYWELSKQISELRGSIASIQARQAITKRWDKEKSTSEDIYKKILEGFVGGEVIGYIDKQPSERGGERRPEIDKRKPPGNSE